MASAHIAVIGGDGIGPEVIDQAIRVTEVALQRAGTAFTWNRLPWSSAFYQKTGQILPDDGWATLQELCAGLKLSGPAGQKKLN